MTALYIISGVSAALIVLLFFPFTFSISSKDGAQAASLWIGFVPVRLLPSKKKKKTKKKSKKGEAKKRPSGKEKERKRSALHTIKLALSLAKRLFGLFGNNVRIKIIRCRIVLGGDDPADTAILYGGINAAVTALVGFLDSLPSKNTFSAGKLKTSRIDIGVDFSEEKTKIDFEMRALLTLGGLIRIFFGLLPIIMDKGKKKDGKHSKRTHDLDGGKSEKAR